MFAGQGEPPITEFPFDFGVVTANTVASFSTMQGGTFRGSANVPNTARVRYAVIRNNTAGTVTVRGGFGNSLIGPGERKRIDFPGEGVRVFLVTPSVTTAAGDLTGDMGLAGVVM